MENKEKKIKELISLKQNPELALYDKLSEIESTLSEALDGVDLKDISEIKGEDGDTPVKGEDYFTDEEKEEIIQEASERAKPIKGKDYFDGKDGKDGKSVDKDSIIKEILSRIPKPENGHDGKDGKDGSPDSPIEIVNKLNTLEEVLNPNVIIGFDSILKSRIESSINPVIAAMAQPRGGGGAALAFLSGNNQIGISNKIEVVGATVENLSDRVRITINIPSGTVTGSGTAGQVAYWDGTSSITGKSTFLFDGATDTLTVHAIRPDASDGLLIESNNGTDVALFGAGGGSNATFYGGVNIYGDINQGLTTDSSRIYRFLGTTSSTQTISFSDTSNERGYIQYEHTLDRMNIGVNGATLIQLSAGTNRVQITGGTLTASERGINISGTLTPTSSNSVYGMLLDLNTSGSASSTFMAGIRVVMNTGYTGTSPNSGLSFYNNVAGTGVDLKFDSANGTPGGNSGFTGFAAGYTTGVNIGGYGEGLNGNTSIGLYGKANTNKTSGVNIGVLGVGRNTGTTPTQIGGWFSLANAVPTWTSAALVADNGDQTSPIFLARDNGTTRFSIADGGYITHTASTISGSSSRAIYSTGTFGTSGDLQGARFEYTSSGTGVAQTAVQVILNAGYTGSSITLGLEVLTTAASTGNDLKLSTNIANVSGNAGLNTFVYGTTTGLNVGGKYEVANGNLNIGVLGKATAAKASATNVAGAFFALNQQSSTTQVGVWASLANTTPTWENGALIADNGGTTYNIFAAKDNGTTVWSIVDGGHTTWGDAINMVFDTTTGTKIGTATSQKIGFWNATPIVQPTTAVAAATFTANTSGIADDTATFDGYTIGQVVKALRNEGLLA